MDVEVTARSVRCATMKVMTGYCVAAWFSKTRLLMTELSRLTAHYPCLPVSDYDGELPEATDSTFCPASSMCIATAGAVFPNAETAEAALVAVQGTPPPPRHSDPRCTRA